MNLKNGQKPHFFSKKDFRLSGISEHFEVNYVFGRGALNQQQLQATYSQNFIKRIFFITFLKIGFLQNILENFLRKT